MFDSSRSLSLKLPSYIKTRGFIVLVFAGNHCVLVTTLCKQVLLFEKSVLINVQTDAFSYVVTLSIVWYKGTLKICVTNPKNRTLMLGVIDSSLVPSGTFKRIHAWLAWT